MTTKLFKIFGLPLFLTVLACSHDPEGDDVDGDGGQPDADRTDDCRPDGGLPPDGGGGADGGTPSECDEDDGCPDGETCEDGVCVCDGDEEDGDDGACRPGKALLCHYPPGNPGNRHEICVGLPAVAAHEAHGDTLGDCP